MMREQLTAGVAWAMAGVWCLTASAMPPGAGSGAGAGADKFSAPQLTDKELESLHKALVARLKLDDKQGPVVRKFLSDYRKDLAAWEKKVDPEVSRLTMRLQMYHRTQNPKAVAVVKATVARLGQITAERKKKHEALISQLKGALTKQQMAEVTEAFSPRRPMSAVASKFHLMNELGLTDAQKAKLKTIMDELRSAQDPKKPGRPSGNPTQKAWSRIISEILTAANQRKLRGLMQEASFRRMSRAMLGDVLLTDKQIARIDVIWKEAHKRALAKPKEKFDLYGQAQGEIMEKVLTADQREHLSNRRSVGKSPRGPSMHGRRASPGGAMPPGRH